jgi:hypothetical protein
VPVAGKVKVDGDLPANLERVRISMAPDEMGGVQFAPVPASQLKADGSFQFDEVGSDRYTVGVTNLPDGFFVKTIRSANLDLLGSGIEIAGNLRAAGSGDQSELGTGHRHGGGQGAEAGDPSHGSSGSAGQGAARQAAVLPHDHLRTQRELHVQGPGSGEYRVYAWDEVEYGAWMDPDFVKPFESRGEAANVGEGARLTVQVNLISADGQ